jgi:DNA invertase Pin-like site-specific DNA recombinase
LALKSLCDQRGYTVDREYVAEGVSAWTGDQRALPEEALRDARAGRFDVLAVWALDRVTREGPAEILRISEEFRKAGVSIVSVQEPWMEDEGDTRDLFISVVGWSSRQESNRKSERNKAAHVRMIAEGVWPGGRPPLGYRRDQDGKLVIDPEEAKTVELIFDLYTNSRIGVRQVKRELEERGVRNRKGGTFWVPSVIERILKDPVYTGRHASGIPVPIIVDTERWQLAQERRGFNHRLKTGYVHEYALQGRAVCECGGNIKVEHPGRGRGEAVYFCNNRYASSYHVMKGGEKCVVPRRRVDEVEFELHRELTDCLNDPGKLSVMVERSIARIEDELASMPGDLAGTRTELEEVIEDLGRVEESWLRRLISADRRDRLIGELESRRDLLEARLEQVSPERKNALEENQEILRGARDYLGTLKARQDLGLPSWKFSLSPSVAESDALQKFRESEYNAFPKNSNRIPEILDRVLTEFNMTAVFKRDRVEVIGGIELEILDRDTHPYASRIGAG